MFEEEWKGRLDAAIKEAGKSRREVSLASGNAHGYVHGILAEGKDRNVERFLNVCAAVPVDPFYILHGIEAKPGDLDILKALYANPDKRAAILALISDL